MLLCSCTFTRGPSVVGFCVPEGNVPAGAPVGTLKVGEGTDGNVVDWLSSSAKGDGKAPALPGVSRERAAKAASATWKCGCRAGSRAETGEGQTGFHMELGIFTLGRPL